MTLARLLAATDLSSPARHAAERAALLAKQTGAALDLLHAVSLTPVDNLRRLVRDAPAEVEQNMLDAAREKVCKLAEFLSQRYGIAASAHVVSGPAVTAIADTADARRTDLIVLGATGESFVRHFLLGSTAARMISKSSRPMLIVKQVPHERYRTVLVPVDFSLSSARALKNARGIAPEACLVLLHAYDVPVEGKLWLAGVENSIIERYRHAAKREAFEKMSALCEEVGLPPGSTRFTVLNGDAVRQILEQEQEKDCDLIVIGKHGESMLEDLLLGSVTRHVLLESQCDVLVSV